MNNFDLKKYLAEGRLFEEAAGYDYASCDGETIELWSKESLNSHINNMAEDEYDGNKEAALGYMKNENMLTKLPSLSYLFVYANNESLDVLDANTKEEFVELVNKEFHGELEGDVDAMFEKIISLANDSSIDGDSSFQQIVIENGKVVGGNSSNSTQDVDTSSYTVVTTKNIKEGKLHEAEMSFDSDIEGKTNKNDFAFWYRGGARGKSQALKAKELLTKNGIDADYSKGPFYINFENSDVEERIVQQILRDANLDRFVIMRNK